MALRGAEVKMGCASRQPVTRVFFALRPRFIHL